MTEATQRNKFRHEMKFLISESEAVILSKRLSMIMGKDPHVNDQGWYVVRSLYFDDLNNTAYHEKTDGVPSRQKFRIRVYNDDQDHITLERKIKEGSYVYKQSAPLDRSQVRSLQNGDPAFLLAGSHPLYKVLYFEMATRVLRPRVIVEYEREPFVYDAGDVRVTFDRNIRAVTAKEDILARELPSNLVLEKGKLILEIKYTDFLPTIIRQMLPGRATEFIAVSKYVACFDKITYKL